MAVTTFCSFAAAIKIVMAAVSSSALSADVVHLSNAEIDEKTGKFIADENTFLKHIEEAKNARDSAAAESKQEKEFVVAYAKRRATQAAVFEKRRQQWKNAAGALAKSAETLALSQAAEKMPAILKAVDELMTLSKEFLAVVAEVRAELKKADKTLGAITRKIDAMPGSYGEKQKATKKAIRNLGSPFAMTNYLQLLAANAKERPALGLDDKLHYAKDFKRWLMNLIEDDDSISQKRMAAALKEASEKLAEVKEVKSDQTLRGLLTTSTTEVEATVQAIAKLRKSHVEPLKAKFDPAYDNLVSAAKQLEEARTKSTDAYNKFLRQSVLEEEISDLTGTKLAENRAAEEKAAKKSTKLAGEFLQLRTLEKETAEPAMLSMLAQCLTKEAYLRPKTEEALSFGEFACGVDAEPQLKDCALNLKDLKADTKKRLWQMYQNRMELGNCRSTKAWQKAGLFTNKVTVLVMLRWGYFGAEKDNTIAERLFADSLKVDEKNELDGSPSAT